MRLNQHNRATLVAGLVLALTGCALPVEVGRLGPSESPESAERAIRSQPIQIPAPAVATPAAAVKPSATPATGVASERSVSVRRGSITETAQFNGRVAGSREVPLSFSTRTGVYNVPVTPGQSVSEGQILLESETKPIAAALSEARVRVDTGQIQIEAGLKQARARKQAAVAEAEDVVRRATSELEQVAAGPPESDRLVAEAAVVAARANLERVEADLERVRAGASEAERRDAAQEVAASRLAFKSAEAERGRLRAVDQTALRSADNDLITAKSGVATAQAELDQLTRPDPYALRAAERQVERARNALRAAEAMEVDATVADRTDAARAEAIANAKLGLREADDQVAKLREPPRPDVLIQARGKLEIANSELAGAQERLATLQKGPDQLTLDKADAAIDAARMALAKSEAHFRDVQSGPKALEVLAAERVVEGAQIGLATAEARLTELTNRPAELETARQRLAAARAALQRARADVDSDPGALDLALLQKALERDRAEMRTLEADLEATRLRAPFAGTVVSVPAQPGETVEAGRPAVVVASEGDPIIVATVAAADDRPPPRLGVGQRATIQIDGGDGKQLEGSITRLADAQTTGNRLVQLEVAWGPTPPPLGAGALVQVLLKEKPDALLLPVSAVRSAGARKYVEYMDGTTRLIADVEVGITTPTEVEIVSGLREGQSVLAPPGPQLVGRPQVSPPLATAR